MNRNFKGVWIPAGIYLSNDLNWSEKILLIEIQSLCRIDKCFASNAYFADFLGLTANRVSKIISGLKEKGYIDVLINQNPDNTVFRTIVITQKLSSLYAAIPEGVLAQTPRGIGEDAKGGIGTNAKYNNTLSNNTYIYNESDKKENNQPSEDKQMIQNELFPAEVFSSENISVETTKTKKSSTKSVKKSDFPPTVEEIDAYLREKDLPLDAFKIWQWYDTTNWCDKSGRKISNWKIKILNSWMSPKYHPELANKHYNDVGHTKPEVDAPKNEVSLPTAEENDASSKQVHEISEAGKRIQAMLRASLKNNS